MAHLGSPYKHIQYINQPRKLLERQHQQNLPLRHYKESQKYMISWFWIVVFKFIMVGPADLSFLLFV